MTEPSNSDDGISNSPDPAADRRAQLAALIPEAFSEGQLDVAALRRALGGDALIEGGERYALTWAGKANAYQMSGLFLSTKQNIGRHTPKQAAPSITAWT